MSREGVGEDDTEVGAVGEPDVAQLALVRGGANDNDHPDLTLVVPVKVIEEALTGNQRPLIKFYEEHKAGVATRPKPVAVSKDKEEALERDILDVFEYHTERVWGRTKRGKKPTLRPDQHRRLRRQLTKEGYSADDLKLAIDGALLSEWHCGKNPGNTEYLGIPNIFPYDGRVQSFIDRCTTSADGHTNVRNVHENREAMRLQLRDIATRMRNGTASIEDKGKFTKLLDELRQFGETYSWQTDKFQKGS